MPAPRTQRLESRGRRRSLRALCAPLALAAGCAGPAFNFSSAPYEVAVLDTPAVELRPVSIPPAPGAEPPAGESADRPIALAEAVLMALRENRQIRVVEFDPRLAELQTVLADSEFDPVLGTGANWTNSHNQSATAIGSLGDRDGSTRVRSLGLPPSAPDSIGVSKRLRSGGQASAGYGLTYDWTDSQGNLVLINPAYRSTVRINIEKPLGRGRGRDVNSLGIAIARANLSQSRHEFELSVRVLVRDVHLAYWNLVGTRMTTESLAESVRTAEETAEQLAAKFELGRSSLPDLAQAVQYAEARRAELVSAENQLLADEQALAGLIGVDPEDLRRLRPTDRPVESRFEVEWEDGVRVAFAKRPELQAGAANLRAARLGLAAAGDGLKPEVTAFAAGAIGGLGDDLDSSLNVLGDGEYGSWSVGVRWDHPIGRRADWIAHEQAQIGLSRARQQLTIAEEAVLRELTQAYRNVQSSYETLRHENARLAAAEIFSDSQSEMYDLGVIEVNDLIAADQQLANARLAAKLRLVEYNVAIVGWRYATGCLTSPDGTQSATTGEAPTSDSRAMRLIKNPPPRPSIDGLPDLPSHLEGKGAVEDFLPPGQGDLFKTPARAAGPDSPPDAEADSFVLPEIGGPPT